MTPTNAHASTHRCLAAALTLALSAATTSHAALLAYEGFNYSPGTTLAGQNGGVGFGVNTWIPVNAGSPFGPTVLTGASEVFAANTAHAAVTSGVAAYTQSNDRRGRKLDVTSGGVFAQAGLLDAAGNVGADGKTVYFSFTQRSANDLPNSFFEFELKRNNLGDSGRILGIGDDVAGNNMNLRTGGNASQSLGPRNLTTNLYVVKIDYLPGNDRVTVYRNPTSATEPGTPTLSVQNADASFDGVSMGAFIGSQGVYTDEIRIGTAFADVITGAAASTQAPSKPDQWRPGFHYSPPRGWLNDPNGLIFTDGKYHLYYQATPGTVNSGIKEWGHATSTDLIHWNEQPLAIGFDGTREAYSGSTVIDYNNTADFGAGAMLAFYTGANATNNPDQNQLLAYSTDGGQTFTRHGEIIPSPRNATGGFIPTRDPSVVWNAATNSWLMAVSRVEGGGGGRPNGIEFYTSPDAKNWTYGSTYGNGGWECPDIFKSPLGNYPSVTKDILMVGTNGATDYHVGRLVGTTFAVEQVIHADYGPDFYAAQQYNDLRDDGGRDVVIAWMSNPGDAGGQPAQTWRGQMTVPRTVEFRQINGRYVAIQNPVAEIDALRERITTAPAVTRITTGSNPLAGSDVNGDMLDLVISLRPGTAARTGIKVHVGPGQETVIGYDTATRRLYIDRTNSSSYSSIPLGIYYAPLELLADGTIDLRILVDRSSVEVFANGGLITMTALSFAESASTAVALFAEGADVDVTRFEAYRLNPAIPEPQQGATSLLLAAPLLLTRPRRP